MSERVIARKRTKRLKKQKRPKKQKRLKKHELLLAEHILPTELWTKVLTYLMPEDVDIDTQMKNVVKTLCMASMVCWKWHDIVYSQYFFKRVLHRGLQGPTNKNDVIAKRILAICFCDVPYNNYNYRLGGFRFRYNMYQYEPLYFLGKPLYFYAVSTCQKVSDPSFLSNFYDEFHFDTLESARVEAARAPHTKKMRPTKIMQKLEWKAKRERNRKKKEG